MEKINLICVTCPIGCNIVVEREGGEIVKITGNTCKRGLAYAKDEVTAPKRVLTTIMRDSYGNMISVKSAKAIPKELLLPAMKVINSVKITAQVSIGDVIIGNILGCGVDIVATKSTEV